MSATAQETAKKRLSVSNSNHIKWFARLVSKKALLLGIGLLLLWEVLGRIGVIDDFTIPLPTSILSTFWELILDGSLFVDLAVSVKRVLVGYAIGIVVGVSLGAVLGWWKGIAEAIVPLIETLRPIPPIAWVPIAILWFGIGDLPAYFIVFLGAVFPIFINTFTGIRAVDPSHVYSAQCLGASRWMMITRVLIPSALPMVMTGLRIGLGVAWMCVVGAELVAAQSGLGYMIEWYRQLLRTDVVLVGMISIGIAGLVSSYLMVMVERWLLPWRRDATDRS